MPSAIVGAGRAPPLRQPPQRCEYFGKIDAKQPWDQGYWSKLDRFTALTAGRWNLATESAHGGYLDYIFNYFEFLRSCEFGKILAILGRPS